MSLAAPKLGPKPKRRASMETIQTDQDVDQQALR